MQRFYFSCTSVCNDLSINSTLSAGYAKGTIQTIYQFQLLHYSRCKDFTLPGLHCVQRSHHRSMNSTSSGGWCQRYDTVSILIKELHDLLSTMISLSLNSVHSVQRSHSRSLQTLLFQRYNYISYILYNIKCNLHR